MIKKKGVTKSQRMFDPRQALFLQYYFDPKSETFANALQSGLRAGFSQEYAESITSLMPSWLSEAIEDRSMISQAEKNLMEFLMMGTVNEGRTMKGEIFEFDDPRLKKIKADVSQFVLERLNKAKYAARTEHTGEGGGPIRIGVLLASIKKSVDEERAPTKLTE